MEAADERRLQGSQKALATHDLLIIDELGFIPLCKTGADKWCRRPRAAP